MSRAISPKERDYIMRELEAGREPVTKRSKATIDNMRKTMRRGWKEGRTVYEARVINVK